MSVSGYSAIYLGVQLICRGSLVECEVPRFDPRTGKKKTIKSHKAHLVVIANGVEITQPQDEMSYADDDRRDSPDWWRYRRTKERVSALAIDLIGDDYCGGDEQWDLSYRQEPRGQELSLIIGHQLAAGSAGMPDNVVQIPDPATHLAQVQEQLAPVLDKLAPKNMQVAQTPIGLWVITTAG